MRHISGFFTWLNALQDKALRAYPQAFTKGFTIGFTICLTKAPLRHRYH